MLLARFCDVNGAPIVSRGTCRIERYTGQGKGWFPIESFNFGFDDREGDKDKPAPTGPGGKPGGQSLPAMGPKGQGGKGGKGGGGGKGSGDFSKVTIDKTVDATSCSLMMLVMEERKSGQGGAKDEKKIEVDIHVISTVNVLQDTKSTFTSSTPFTFTSVLIHLEAVNVLGWSIKGSGDLRPSETVSLRYDRAAMIYNEFDANSGKFQYGPQGWDQTNCKRYGDGGDFRWSLGDYKEYLP